MKQSCEAVHKTDQDGSVTEQAPPAGTPDLAPQDAGAAQAGGAPAEADFAAARASVTGAQAADVIVVGAGPAGSAVAYYLATSGLDVLMLEKAHFPREKVCGDGLTPRAVKALTAMG
ncbi:MAG: FAD-dependent oxidoreductase, partial [Actinobacteria bacterium]|nr:FAD-dependent oxidoreductase [Actinomycetota bacterium]